MATLTITGSGTQDFRASVFLDPIDVMQFGTSGNTIAVFDSSQFSATQILPDVQIIGDAFVNRIRVFVPTDGVFSAAGWTLTNWSGTELTGIEGDKDLIVIEGAAGNEAITGSAMADLLRGFDGNDTLNGGAGSDGLTGGFNNDALNGGPGFDYAIYSDSVESVKVSLAVAGPQNTNWGNDTLTGIEGLIGSNYKDTLTGNDKANELYGNSGNDTLRGGLGADLLDGGPGNDVLIGGRGKDILNGGPGKDFFEFNSIKESVDGGNRDKIVHFSRSQDDRIDLRDIDAKTGKSGNQKFEWIGKSKFHDEKGELRYIDKGSTVIVQGDVNGDGKADFEIYVKVGALSSGDFFL